VRLDLSYVENGSVMVISPSPQPQYLPSSAAPERARRMGERGRAAVNHHLGMSYVAQGLGTSCSAAVSSRRRIA
jgi:hypothetical protein